MERINERVLILCVLPPELYNHIMKPFHLTILFITVVATLTVGYLIFYVSPFENNEPRTIIVFLLLLCVALGITGLTTLITYPIRAYAQPYLDERALTRTGIRQGAIIGLCIAALLLLSIMSLLNIFTGLLTVATAIVIEWLFH